MTLEATVARIVPSASLAIEVATVICWAASSPRCNLIILALIFSTSSSHWLTKVAASSRWNDLHRSSEAISSKCSRKLAVNMFNQLISSSILNALAQSLDVMWCWHILRPCITWLIQVCGCPTGESSIPRTSKASHD